MKKAIPFLLFVCLAFSLSAQQPHIDGFLPIELTAEEKLRLHEIDRFREATDPPPQPARNIAEFEPMSAALVRYPLAIPVALVALMAEEIEVISIVADQSTMNQAINHYQNNGVNMDNCSFLVAPTNSVWTRDYGPWFIFNSDNAFGIMDFEYDRPRPLDNAINALFASENDINYYHMGLVHTGGDYMTDGMGISASTSAAYSVNNNYTPAQVDSIMNLYLGIEHYHVVPNIHGGLSHIDTWAKFLAPDKIMIREVAPDHPYYTHAEQAVAYFESQISSYGTPYRVYRVYTPNNEPYSNTLILNNRVFVPTTGSQWDDAAIASFEAAMPGYEVHGILYNYWNSNDALHCRVKDIADRDMLYIHHMPVIADQQHDVDYEIRARIIPMSGEALYADSLRVYYRIDEGDFYFETMTHDEGDWYNAFIPQQDVGMQVDYYIRAADASGRGENHPYIGAYDPHGFGVIGPLVLIDVVANDANTGNENGIFEPGETVELIATYRNDGGSSLHGLHAQLSSPSPYIHIHPPGQAALPLLEPGEEATFSFMVSASLATPNVYQAYFDISIFTNEGFDNFDSFDIEITSHVVAEYLLQENFDEWPPEGWELISTADHINWRHFAGELAGGTEPEAQFHYDPSTLAIQRLITPSLNTADFGLIELEFKHLIDHYSGEYLLSVETSGDGGSSWNEIMGFPNVDRPATTETYIIDNDDVGSDSFRIAWTFNGDSWNINWWNIDDVMVGGITLHDNLAYFEGEITLNGGPGDISEVWITAGDQVCFPSQSGFYSLAILSGSHELTASLAGYVPQTVEGIIINPGETLLFDFDLIYIAPPENLSYEALVNEVLLSWDMPGEALSANDFNEIAERNLTHYNIFRNHNQTEFEWVGSTEATSHTDAIGDTGHYQYYVTAVYDDEYESEPSESIELTMYQVLFAVEGENGSLTATAAETGFDSGDLLAGGTTIEFMATPDAGFKVNEWKLDGEVQSGESDNSFILANLVASVEVSVSFEAIMHLLTFGVLSGNGSLLAEVEGTEIFSGDEVAEGSDVYFYAFADAGYAVNAWLVNDSIVQGWDEPEYLLEYIQTAIDVRVEFKNITHIATGVAGEWLVYPNPTRKHIYVHAPETILQLSLIDLNGDAVRQLNVNDHQAILQTGDLAAGVYLLQLHTARGLFTKRLIIVP